MVGERKHLATREMRRSAEKQGREGSYQVRGGTIMGDMKEGHVEL